VSDKGFITRIFRKPKTVTSQRVNNALNKWANELNRQFSNEEVQRGNKHMKRCSTSLAIKEMQIKITLQFHFTPVRRATINIINNNKCLQGCWEKGKFQHCWWNVKFVKL
jgi:hypothetical protein